MVVWIFTSGSDVMGFVLVFLWILIPVSTFVISFLIGKTTIRTVEAALPLAFGVMHTLAEYSTFSTANMVAISFSRINMPLFESILISAVISVIGLGLGTTLNHQSVRC